MNIKKIFKTIVSLLFVGFIIYRADWTEIKFHLLKADWFILVMVLSLKTIQFPVNVLKWRKCLEMHEIAYPFKYLLKILCMGFLFNNLLPSTIGGDGYRIIKTTPKEGIKSRAISAVLMERILGVLSLVFLGWIGSAIAHFKYDSEVIRLYFFGGTIALLLLSVMIVLYRNDNFRHKIKQYLFTKKWGPIIHNLEYIKNNRQVMLPAFFYSILFHLIAISTIFLIFKAFGGTSFFMDCAVMAALSQIVAALPVSINGLGISEGTFVYVAMQIGIHFDMAVIIAFMIRVITIPFSLACGVVYIMDSINERS